MQARVTVMSNCASFYFQALCQKMWEVFPDRLRLSFRVGLKGRIEKDSEPG